MPGLNYGYTYQIKKQHPEGVVFAEKINKWVVRIKKKGMGHDGKGVLQTLAAYDKKEDAEDHYNRVVIKEPLK